MPPNPEEPIYEVNSTNSPPIPASPVPQSLSPSESSTSLSTDTDSLVQLDPTSIILYGKIHVPLEETLRELLQRITGKSDVTEITSIKLKVISREICLQHLSAHAPNLLELILDGSVVSSLRDLGCGLRNLKVLKVSRCGLTTLDGLFGLESLVELHAANNSIEDISYCSCLPHIELINLKKNLLQDISSLTFLTMCTNLEHLVLEENEDFTDFPKYRQTVKNLLPNLKTLDGQEFTIEECSKDFSDLEDEDETDPDSYCSSQDTNKKGFLPPILQVASPKARCSPRSSNEKVQLPNINALNGM